MALDYSQPYPLVYWYLVDPVIPTGVKAYAHNGAYKLGNGTSAWSALPWIDGKDGTVTPPAGGGGGTTDTTARASAQTADDKAVAADSKAVSAASKAQTADDKAVAAATKAQTADDKAVTADGKAVAAKTKADAALTPAAAALTYSKASPFGGSTAAAAMADDISAPGAYPTVVDLASTSTSYAGSPRTFPSVTAGTAAAPFRYLLSAPGVSGASVVPFAMPIGGNARAIAFDQALAVAFDIDGSSFELIHTRSAAATSFRVWVNEQQGATVTAAADGSSRYKITLGAAREMRRVVIEFDRHAVFGGVTVASTDTILPPQDGATRKLAYIGDSYSWGQGYKASGGSARSLFTSLARRLGFGHYRRFSAPGTGLINAASYSPYQARLADVIAENPTLVVLQGSINDNGQSGILEAATLAIQTLQAGLPAARIVVTGVLRSYGATAADLTTNAALSAAATATGVTYVDPSSWCTGTGSVVSPNGTGNADVYNFQFSADHPSPGGHQYLGRRLAFAIADALGHAIDVRPQPLAETVRAAVAALPAPAGGGTVQPLNPSPPWNGFSGWTYDPFLIAAGMAPIGGTVYLGRVFLPAGTTASNVTVNVATAGAGVTVGLVGLYDAGGTLRASSADQSAAFMSAGVKTVAMSAAYVTPADGFYYVALLGQATTAPQFSRGSSAGLANLNLSAGVSRGGNIGTALSALPATLNLSGMTPLNTIAWAGVS